ncbi:MAG: alpha-amylase family glycosyl hydrolase [Rhodothermales bacterium]
MADFGYDVADYTDVDPVFGTLNDFDLVVAEAHRLGLRVIIDFVPNHSSDQHPWFKASRQSRTNSKRDWYIWRDPAPDGGPPNNWLSVFGGPAWTFDEATGQYYLHSFLKEQPDLNWRNPEVEAAMHDALRFWMARGVDGFRIDVAHFIMKDPELRDDPPNPGGTTMHKDMGAYGSLLHVHSCGHEDVHAAYRRMRRVIDTYEPTRERYMVGETHLFDWKEWARYYGDTLDEMHQPFNFGLLNVEWTAEAVRAHVDAIEAVLPEGAWPTYVLDNHDETRLATRYGEEYVGLAAMLLLTLRGTPTLYYGDELGMPEANIPPDRQHDPWGQRVPGLGRDGCRTPMQWDASPGAGFTMADPWLPIPDDYRTRNVAEQHAQADSTLALYKRLLALRSASPALHQGAYHPLDIILPACFAFERVTEQERRLIVLNFSDAAVDIDVPNDYSRVVCSTASVSARSLNGQQFTIAPFEGVIVAP